MPSHGATHTAFVESWLEGSARGLSHAGLISLFERALAALWRRTEVTLGEITLTAVADRVLCVASETYPSLAALKVEGTGVRFDEYRQEAVSEDGAPLEDVVRFVLVEFLTVLGNLTDEILTPALHAALSSVAPKGDGGVAEGARS